MNVSREVQPVSVPTANGGKTRLKMQTMICLARGIRAIFTNSDRL